MSTEPQSKRPSDDIDEQAIAQDEVEGTTDDERREADESLETADAEPAEASELEALQSALNESEESNTQLRESMLRMQAEMENLRKRLMRDLERSRKRALEALMSDLLPVRDSLERGLEMASEDASVETLREGNALIIKMLGKAMSDHGLLELDPSGEAFNPEQHEAISLLPSADHDRDTVMDVVQKGYMLNDFLIRPARVVVSSGDPGS